MNNRRNFLPLIMVFLSLTSCIITDNILTTRIEVLKPSIFGIPKDLTVAIFKSDLLHSDSSNFKYSNGFEDLKDPSINYQVISDSCVNALANYLKKEGYFSKVINYNDSLNYFSDIKGQAFTTDKLVEKTKSDVCIFLDQLYFDTYYISYSSVPFNIHAKLSWTVFIKNDSTKHYYKQTDTLVYYKSQVHRYKDKKTILKQLISNSSKYLGQSFGTKVIPSWMQVDRMYYKSNNHHMLLAEKYALDNNWIKAAELWNKETTNKNQIIAAKACFNMALACEMEGKPEVGIDWLEKSSNQMFKNRVEHGINCRRYSEVLTNRIGEIVLLSHQVTNPEINSLNE